MYIPVLLIAMVGLVSSSLESARAPLIRNEQARQLLRQSIKNNQFRKREPLLNADGREYLVQVGVGTPPQVFNLTLDTGSSELWVPSIKCAKTICPYERFDTSRSSSLTQTNEPFSIQYGQGNAKGTYGQETISVGTAKVMNQKIGLVNSTKDILGVVTNGVQSNGIFGLGYPGLNSARGVQNDTPFAFNLMQQNQQLDSFSIYLTNSGGEIIFGGVDKTKFKGDLQYAPVVDYSIQSHQPVSPNVGNSTTTNGTYLYWTVPGQGISTSTNYSYSPTTIMPFVLDTGTTLTYMPAAIAKKVVDSLTKKKAILDVFNLIYRVDCGLRSSQETISFRISTSTTAAIQQPLEIVVSVSQLVIPIDTNDVATATSCMFAIAPADEASSLSSAPTWLLGEATLRAVYAVYDMKQNRVGFAPYSTDGSSTASSSSSSSSSVGGGTASSSTSSSQQSNVQVSSGTVKSGTLSPFTLTIFILAGGLFFY
ncbi:aspartic peptidase domain-containing protein [Chlamydoabsidia padenii]|nr:aspartic peptidase domain-containing protein [Chlamydoabsidia padenii]